MATARWEATIVVPPCLLILLVLLYGRATACRACGLGREEFEKDGVCRNEPQAKPFGLVGAALGSLDKSH